MFPAQSATLDADYANVLAANAVTAVGAQAAANILAVIGQNSAAGTVRDLGVLKGGGI